MLAMRTAVVSCLLRSGTVALASIPSGHNRKEAPCTLVRNIQGPL